MDCDVISGRLNVKTIVGYVLVNFEITSFNSFRDMIQKKSFRDGGGDGGGRADIDKSSKRKRIRVSLNNHDSRRDVR